MEAQSTPLDRVVAAVGSKNELAAQLGITAQAISQWRRVPTMRVLEVERLSGIPRHELRPDVYPEPA